MPSPTPRQTIFSTTCVLEHLNHRLESRFNYTRNNFRVSMGREAICMLISVTAVMTCNKSNICCLIKSDIRALPKSSLRYSPWNYLLAEKILLGKVLAANTDDVISPFSAPPPPFPLAGGDRLFAFLDVSSKVSLIFYGPKTICPGGALKWDAD